MARIVLLVALLSVALLVGCERASKKIRSEQPETPLVTDVVARVGRISIGTSEVVARMAEDELSADAALERLIDEALLVQEAERIGFTADRASERVVERLMVRAMLHDLETDNTPQSIPEAEVRAAYAEHAGKLPASERPTLDEVQDEIRRRLSQKKRYEKVRAIVQSLEARGIVRYDDAAVQRALRMPGLPKPAE